MAHRDARKLSRETQAELRRIACHLHDELGLTDEELAPILEVSTSAIRSWLAKYKREGEELFEVNEKRGHPEPKLNEEQQAWMKQAMTEHTPDQLGLPGEWWTPPLARALAKKQFDIEIGASTIYQYLHQWKFRPRVPLRRACRRDPQQLREWVEADWPEVVKKAEAGAEVVFLDEAQVREDHVCPRVWTHSSERPIVVVSGKRARVNIISAINVKGKLWWQCYTESLDSERFCHALKALYTAMETDKLIIVLDRLSVHLSEETTAWLKEHLPKVELVLLPTYSPELNPDEQVWAHLKAILHRFTPLKISEHVGEAVTVEMHRLKKDRKRIKQLFFHPDLEYLHEFAKATNSP